MIEKEPLPCDECIGGYDCEICDHHIHKPGKCLVINCGCGAKLASIARDVYEEIEDAIYPINSDAAIIRVIQVGIDRARIEALEEAARAVCKRCRNGEPVRLIPNVVNNGIVYDHDAGNHMGELCHARNIHKLLVAGK